MTIRYSHARRWLMFGIILMLALLTSPAYALPTELRITGYVQGRYADTLDGAPSTFEVRRAFLNIRAQLDDHVGAYIQFAGMPTTRVQLAYGEYTTPPWTARLGLVSLPFGYESPLSSSRLLTLERSEVISALISPSAFDRGLVVAYLPATGLTGTMSLVNGESVAVPADTNAHKNLVARLGYPLPGGGLGLSIYDGTRAGSTETLHLVGVDGLISRGAMTLVSEVVIGRDAEREPMGGYLTVAYRTAGSSFQPYLRFDAYDRDRDASGDLFRRATIGNLLAECRHETDTRIPGR